jgi:hypothetical protein
MLLIRTGQNYKDAKKNNPSGSLEFVERDNPNPSHEYSVQIRTDFVGFMGWLTNMKESTRDLRIMRLLALGKTRWQAGRVLGLSSARICQRIKILKKCYSIYMAGFNPTRFYSPT